MLGFNPFAMAQMARNGKPAPGGAMKQRRSDRFDRHHRHGHGAVLEWPGAPAR
jgi:hypothetical protein